LGARGGKVKYDNGSDAGGILLDITDAADALGPFKVLADPLTSLFLATLSLAVDEGDKVHQDMVKHRNLISQLQCAYAGLVSFSNNYTNTNDKSVGTVANNFISSYFLIQTCSNILKVE
jgi:hypothetical protein